MLIDAYIKLIWLIIINGRQQRHGNFDGNEEVNYSIIALINLAESVWCSSSASKIFHSLLQNFILNIPNHYYVIMEKLLTTLNITTFINFYIT